MAFSEVYGTLRQEVVDGQENTRSNIYVQDFFEVRDGVAETNHGIIDHLVATSVDWPGELDPSVRDQFLSILAEVTQPRNSGAFAVNQANRQAIPDAGGVVRELSYGLCQAWVDAMESVWGQFSDDVGEENIAAAKELNLQH